MQDGDCECENVSDDEEVDLRPHELVLRVPTPLDKDAILTWGSKFACSKDVQLIVAEAEAPPDKGHRHCPQNEEELESEMQHHARASDICDTQVGVEWVELAADVTHFLCPAFPIVYLFECFCCGVQLHVGPVQIPALQSCVVDVWAGAQISDC
jgi:hypothetical protein